MAIAQLVKMVEPPANPREVGSKRKWQDLERSLGTLLPDDYFDLIMTYGSGHFRFGKQGSWKGWVRIYNPFSAKYMTEVERICDCLRGSKDFLDEDVFEYLVYPDNPGLLPLGTDAGGCELLYYTKRRPNDWPVVVKVPDGCNPQFQQEDMTVTEFLVRVFGKKIESIAWGKDMFVGRKPVYFEQSST